MPDPHQIPLRSAELYDKVTQQELEKLKPLTGIDSSSIVGFHLDLYWTDLAKPRLSFTGQMIRVADKGLHLSYPLRTGGLDYSLEGMMVQMDDVLLKAIQGEIARKSTYDWTRGQVYVFQDVCVMVPAPPDDLIKVALMSPRVDIASALRVMCQSGLSAHKHLQAYSTANHAVKMVYDAQRRGITPNLRPASLSAEIEVITDTEMSSAD
jgi:hypothetical protein